MRNYPTDSRAWGEQEWVNLLQDLVSDGLVTYGEIGALVLGHLNPSQVGTSIASKATFQTLFPPRKCWEAVRTWHFNERGRCADCGTRLELQADHIIPRQVLGNAADTLTNLTLRCRRCNVIRRPSHLKGGQTHLTAESALMWILFIHKPTTYQEYSQLCRNYGLTMANIRFEEAWAMAIWLSRDGLYQIDPTSKYK